MKRRAAIGIGLLSGPALLAGGPLAAQPGLPVVAFLGFADQQADWPMLEALRRGLADLGRIEGRTIRIETRHSGGDMGQAERDLRDLIALAPSVFVAPGPAATRLVRRATNVPIVAVGLPTVSTAADLFSSLRRPGGTVTGFSTFGEELSAKRIQILRDALPGQKVIGILHNISDPVFREWGEQTASSATAQQLQPFRLGVARLSEAELAGHLRALKQAGGRALIVVRDFMTTALRESICALALELDIAVLGEYAAFAESGALLSYGPDMPDLSHRAASYVERILRGEAAGELPIQLPTKFELVVNLRTARKLGVTLPRQMLLGADRLIEP